ncbi:MAG: hypothetical protein GY847_12530 [Proteobacteria bacterium]|nr:hypothetical protein [Pseudomonadota bacterium]
MNNLARFGRKFFTLKNEITQIGSGSIGGKAMGLVSMAETIQSEFPHARFPGISVSIPQMAVIATECFDAFLKLNDLRDEDLEGLPDDRVAHIFQRASFPAKFVGDLRALASEVHTPLAIRSSSLLEDEVFRPLAGVYKTKMIPNNQPSADMRFKKLVEAIKFVYASAFFKDARRYIYSIEKEMRDEKMAVIIQAVVGQRYQDRFYPNVSGVARSYNYYPTGNANPEDGVVSLALGLGKTIVDGGTAWSYSPAYPKAPPLYNNFSDMMKNTQTQFWAVNMGKPPAYDPTKETEYLVKGCLPDADYDNTLKFVASTCSSNSNRIVPGTGPDGPRILNFAPLLVLNELPLADLVRELLLTCEQVLDAKVEIEFAVNLDRKSGRPAWFGFLQVRPMVVFDGQVDLPVEHLAGKDVLAASENVLGNGIINAIEDIVYVRPDVFEPKDSRRVALEIEKINSALVAEKRPYLLIGIGRLGTSDPWRGIPAVWSQFSGAKVIVETELKGMETEFSQGSHFFHNLTSFKVCYFHMPLRGEYSIDWNYLGQLDEVAGMTFVRHVRAPKPLVVKVDGRSRRGVILHNGKD